MATPYEKIYAKVLPKFRSYEIPLMQKDEVEDYLYDHLISAISEFHVCRKDLSDRDEELKCFNKDLNDIETEILANYIVMKYVEATYINTPTLLKANLSSTDFNSYSSANMLDKLNQTQKRNMSENEKLLSRYAWMGIRDKKIRSNILGNVYNKSEYMED